MGVERLDSIDVTDDTVDEVSGSVFFQAGRGQRHDPAVDVHAEC